MRVTAALLLLAGPASAGSYRPPPSLELLDLRGQVSFNPTPVNASSIPPRNPGGRPKDCPPCFNCQLPAFNCGQFGDCNKFDGQCKCPAGFGGQDCSTPLCGSLKDGDERYPRPDGESCKCEEGWGGINCNVCKNDKACKGFKSRNPVDDMLFGQDKHKDKDGDKDGDGGDDEIPDMVCYQGGVAIERNFQMCDVTNRKIRDTIPDNKPPQVTFSCEAGGHHANGSDIMSSYDPTAIGNEKGTCGFQFWVDRIESFYCKLTECTWESDQTVSANETHYKCENIECACVPGRFLCGENGSVNIDDFLTEEVRGPGSFNCISGKGCTFEEPAMNKLINDIFGDSSITLDCESGECVHYSQVPGYVPPAQPDNTKFIALMGASSVSLFLAACLFFWYMGRNNDASGFSGIKLPEDEAARLMAEHVPATSHFSNISYTLPSGKHILEHVTGTCRPGEVLAIMGASGAGKSTSLDILARKSKTGKVSGEMYVNGRTIDNSTFRRIEGFVDQEDTLLPTSTVYETVLFSALLRLPREMSYEAKVYRTLETMNELGISGIRDARIGESGKRSISGGEKRRVSIACESVTGPSISFLDEPTSGLDSYNAYNVIDALKTLAKQYNRTVIFTIHQPQSNIVASFDRLLILAKGQLVFSGKQSNAQAHFESNGYPCPPGYNIADYVIDVTVDAAGDARKMTGGNGLPTAHSGGNGGIQDPEAGFSRRAAQSSSTSTDDEASVSQSGIKMKAAKLLGAFTSTSGTTTPAESVTPIPEASASLVLACRGSDDMKIVEAEVHRIETGETPNGGEQRDIAEETAMSKGYDKAGFWTQFKVLSGRAFRNLYRNPMLMAAHYAVAICAGFLCGFFFYHVTNDIPGFQNRLGLFSFISSSFGFSTSSAVGLFSTERVSFMRERANGYYSSGAYFLAKVSFDVIPLRVIPPFILGSIVYGLAGSNPDMSCYWKFIMISVLFNSAAASIVLFLSVAISDTGVANSTGSSVMSYNLLFAGSSMNYDRVPNGSKWMQTLSFFHAAYEALLVNESRYLQLVERKFGLDIRVPSATILSSFGFHAQAFWFPDTTSSIVVFLVFIVASYLVLESFVKERR